MRAYSGPSELILKYIIHFCPHLGKLNVMQGFTVIGFSNSRVIESGLHFVASQCSPTLEHEARASSDVHLAGLHVV